MQTKTDKRNLTLLFLNAGRRIELMQAFRGALREFGLEGKIIATDINELAPALYEADVRHILPRSRNPEFVAAFCNLCAQEKVDLIIPLIDPDLLILAQNRSTIEATGARILLSNENVIEICSDKNRTYEFLKRNNFSTPEVLSLRAAQRHRFPMFIKPKNGSASIDTFVLRNSEELQFFVRYVRNPIIQEFVDGEEITIDVFSDWNREPILAIPRRRLKVRDGEVSVGRVERNAEVETLCKKVAKRLGTVGPINIQVIRSKDGLYVVEINPRFGGGCPLSIAAGAPFGEWSVLMGLEEPVTGESAHIRNRLTMMRFHNSHFLSL